MVLHSTGYFKNILNQAFFIRLIASSTSIQLMKAKSEQAPEHLVDLRLVDQAEAQRAVSTKVEAQKAVHQVGKGAGVQLWTNSLASLLIGRAVVGSQ